MSVAGHTPPPFFKRGPAPLVKLVFFVGLSIALLITDIRFHTLEWLRMAASIATYPLQRAASLPIEGASGTTHYLTSLASLHKENDELRRKQLLVANQLLRQHYLEDENKRLRALLRMKDQQRVNGIVADIQYAARDPFSRRIVISKGSNDGVKPGNAVVDDVGVIGQVTRAFPLMAEVTLLTDKNQAVPIEIQRNGLRAILAGVGVNGLEVRFLAANAEIVVGDILITSGLDGIYPRGIPVARVTSVERDTAFTFARIRCEPLGAVEGHGQVLVLDSANDMVKVSEEVLKQVAPENTPKPKGGLH